VVTQKFFPIVSLSFALFFMGCRRPVHVSVRVRRCYLDPGFFLKSIGYAFDPSRGPQSPDTTWEKPSKIKTFFQLRCF